MFVINLNDNKAIVKNYRQQYEQIEREQTGKRPWLDAGFYQRQNIWLQENFHCIYLPNKNQLVFKDEKDYFLFKMRWDG